MKKLLAIVVTAALAIPAFGTQITAPGDPLIGGQILNGSTTFDEGTEGFDSPANNWPGAENPSFAVDGTTSKYLNFGQQGTGILISPAGGESILNQITVYTANDAVERDPTSYVIWGSSDPSVHASNFAGDGMQSMVDLSTFSVVNGGPLNLPETGAGQSRNEGGLPIDDALYFTTTTFENTDAHCTYIVMFPDVKNDPSSANSMQIAELELHGSFTGNICPVPEPSAAALIAFASLLAVPALRRRK